MVYVRFTLITDSKEDMDNKVNALKILCDNNGLNLSQSYFINSYRKTHAKGNPDQDIDYRFTLDIEKNKGITYNNIYHMVNSIQPCRYTIIR